MNKRNSLYILIAIPVMILLAIALYQVPFINQRLAWRVDNWKAQVKYALNPPEEEIFVPGAQQAQVSDIAEATFQALTFTPPLPKILTPTITTTPHPQVTPTITPTPTPTPTPRSGPAAWHPARVSKME